MAPFRSVHTGSRRNAAFIDQLIDGRLKQSMGSFLMAKIDGWSTGTCAKTTLRLPDEPGLPGLKPVIKVVLSESSEGLKSGIAPATENSPEVVRPRLDIGLASTKESEFRSVFENLSEKAA